MNTDTGEIRQFTAEEVKALAAPWTPLSRAELRSVGHLPQAERPAALRADRGRAKRRKLAAASRRRNRR